MFTSDHGVMVGAHRLPAFGKGNAYEEAIRVPYIVRGPGISASSPTTFALTIDLAPTIAELAGVPALPFVDGVSLAPALAGDDGGQRSFLVEQLADIPVNRHGYTVPTYVALRTQQYLYVEIEATEETELYDLAVDPYQLENISAAQPDLVQQLSTILEALSDCAGADCNSEVP